MQKKNSSQHNIIILTIVGTTAIICLLILFTDAQKTAKASIEQLESARLPYLESRTLSGIKQTPEGIPVYDEERAFAEGIPFRSFSRVPDNIPSLYVACGETYIDASLRIKKDIESLIPNEYCEYYDDLQVYCCSIPILKIKNYANAVDERAIH